MEHLACTNLEVDPVAFVQKSILLICFLNILDVHALLSRALLSLRVEERLHTDGEHPRMLLFIGQSHRPDSGEHT